MLLNDSGWFFSEQNADIETLFPLLPSLFTHTKILFLLHKTQKCFLPNSEKVDDILVLCTVSVISNQEKEEKEYIILVSMSGAKPRKRTAFKNHHPNEQVRHSGPLPQWYPPWCRGAV